MAHPHYDNNQKWLQQMKDGKPKLGVNLNLGHSNVAELVASYGFDWVMVDAQHSPVNRESLCGLLQAIKLGGAKSFIRVEGFDDNAGIQQAFDCGVDGILVPSIRTASEVQQAVTASKYPGVGGNEGDRSLYVNLRPQFPLGGGVLGMMGSYNGANKTTLVAVQIETREAVENLDEILAVPGLDLVFIGPGDLASSMGLLASHGPGAFSHPDFGAALGKVLAGCAKPGVDVIPGMWALDTKLAINSGFKFLCVGSDIEFLRAGMQATLNAIKDSLKVDTDADPSAVPAWSPKPAAIDPSDV